MARYNWKDDSFHSDELLDEEIVEFTYWREMPEGPESQEKRKDY
jgi:hypothetical protein